MACGMFSAAGFGQSQGLLDFYAKNGESIPVGDSTALLLLGDVILHHNGAILTCDSAIRYNPNYMEFFGNVIINKDSTYIYGDRADVNGLTNLANVYAPIIKTVDGDVTMYSTTMEFNTLTKIGRFTQGGTISQKDNLIEAVEGIYHVDQRDIYFVNKVAMRNEEYLMQTDSMGYNFDTEISTFYRPAKIWNKDGDFLSADLGHYDRLNDVYNFEKNSYILTKEQEVFADSILYMKTAGVVSLFGNAQIHDREQKAYLFGDYGVYWTESQQAIMSENPSAMGYDDEAESPDSIYVRGDVLMMHTFSSDDSFTEEIAASLVLPRRDQLDYLLLYGGEALWIQRPDSLVPDSLSNWSHLYGEGADSLLLEYGMRGMPPDSLPERFLSNRFTLDSLFLSEFIPDSLLGRGISLDSLLSRGIIPDSLLLNGFIPDSLLGRGISLDSLIPNEFTPEPPTPFAPDGGYAEFPDSLAYARPDSNYFIRMDDLPADSLAGQSDPALLPSKDSGQEISPLVAADSLSAETIQEPAVEKPKTKRELRRERRLEKRKVQMREYAIREGILPPVDSLALADSLQIDSLPVIDSLQVDTIQRDSLQRVLRAFNNVRVFRSDMQAVCDSLLAFSIDTTVHMHIRPILWNEENQIVAEIVRVFSRNEQLYRADFEENPIMVQWVIDSLYNQVTGDRMEAFFENNNIRRLEVLNNSKAYYYLQENNPEEIGGFLDLESKDMFFIFNDSMRLEYLKAETDDVYAIYPMDKIPETHTQRFPNFEWLPHLRPKDRWDVCDREFRPSTREASESIPYPQFRITERIEADKKRYIQQGVWSDRNDTISVDPSYLRNITD